MKFDKSPLTVADLAAHLASLGLTGDRDYIARRILDVGYYRLSPYWRYFVQADCQPAERLSGVDFQRVWQLYTFDRELRLLTLDAIERIEVAVRARTVQRHVMDWGPFGYLSAEGSPGSASGHRQKHFDRLLKNIERAMDDAKGRNPKFPALRHFVEKYGKTHSKPPLWLAAEGFTFGDMVTLFNVAPRQVRRQVADDFDLSDGVLSSWLSTLGTVRNICAHHGRLWNRRIGTQPRNGPGKTWQAAELGPKDRVFYALTICAYLLGVISEGSSWASRLRALFERYADVPKVPMGVGARWESHPVWQARLTAHVRPPP